jgi:hypothetical protein
MEWTDIPKLLPAIVFVVLLLRRPLIWLQQARERRREAERDGFRRAYEPIEPD